MIYKSKGEEDTKKIAKLIVKKYFPEKRIFLLTGELGTGKTKFTQGFARALSIKDRIISPTFVLIRQHKIPKFKKTLYHIDLYRIVNFEGLGLEDLINDENAILLIEWAEKLNMTLPLNTVKINISKISDYEREIEVSD